VFGATERMRLPGPGGAVAHAEIQIGDSVVIVEDESPQRGTKAPPPGHLSTAVQAPSRDLVDDAEWLASLLHQLMPTEPEVAGLLA
jgi:uncharacterized glyoxalase superfamily protein PhnB